MAIDLLSGREETRPHWAAVRAAADSEKDAFGFLPASAYEELAFQGRMIVAIDRASRNLLGYILYGGALPQGKIFQTWANNAYRAKGVGRILIGEVVRRLEALSYLSIRADVADDLAGANSFYARMGFDLVTRRPGKTRGRTINVRVRELATPSLLELAGSPSQGTTRLPCEVPTSTRAPLYLIDLNVLFDVVRKRPKSAEAGRVLAAAFENDVKVAVSSEFSVELERHTIPQKPDPILEIAKALPRLPLPNRQRTAELISELSPIVFPERNAQNILTDRDLSDLRHIATAVEECAAGFITSEKAILRAAPKLQQQYGIEIASPEAFGAGQESESDVRRSLSVLFNESPVEARQVAEHDRSELEAFLKNFGCASVDIRTMLSAGTATQPRRRYLFKQSGEVVGYGSWEAPGYSRHARELRILLDEGNSAVAEAGDYLVRRALADIGRSIPTSFRVRAQAGQTTLRRVAIANGFFSVPGSSPRAESLQKVCIGAAVLPEKWAAVASALKSEVGLSLPTEAPVFQGGGQMLRVEGSGAVTEMSLRELEGYLSPVMFILPERPGVILPIRAAYAEELFRGSIQPSLLSERRAALRSNRGYISAAGTFGAIPEGGLAVFYESGAGSGRSAAIAVARISRKYLSAKEGAENVSAQKGVLDNRAIRKMGSSKQVVVTEFEDLMMFSQPVPFRELKRIGCVDGANLVTARAIGADRLLELINTGQPRV